MITFEEAYEIVTGSAVMTTVARIPLATALGRVIAEDAASDMDMPPFDKSAMDGFACRRSDLPGPLSITETIPAGVKPTKATGVGECSRIMTGSMVPAGADCVIKVEDTEVQPGGMVKFIKEHTENNICYQGEDIKKGQVVIRKGTLLAPQHMAILAGTGHSVVNVFRLPSIAVIATGDELVEPEILPEPAQIRNSNALQLLNQAKGLGDPVIYMGIAPDREEALTDSLVRAKESADIILLSGGVSMGDYDLVPGVIEKAGFKILFNKLAVQPGSPTVFASDGSKFCFGLPGNPVSSFVQFENLVKPFIYKMTGHEYRPLSLLLPLAAPMKRKNIIRKAFLPVKLLGTGEVKPAEYHGSAHIHAYAFADGIMEIPAGTASFEKGDLVNVRLL